MTYGPGNTLVREVRDSVVLIVTLFSFINACSQYRKQLAGPDAFGIWASEYAKRKGCTGKRTSAEGLRIHEDLVNRVDLYINKHPDLVDLKTKQLQELTVHLGMTKEEVRALLAEPSEVLKTQERLSGMAKDEWKETEEAWLYQLGGPNCSYYETYILYFRADNITHIVRVIPPIWGP